MDESEPLIGRHDELRMIRSDMAEEQCTAIVIAGKSGTGRSRLLHQAVYELADADHAPRLLYATAATSTIPFGAVARMLPDRPEGWASSAELLRATVALWSEPDRSGGRPVIAVDDAHLLDAQSAALLHQLVVHGQVCVVMTVLDGSDAPDAITAIWKDFDARLIELRPLSMHETGELLRAQLGGPVDGAAIQAIAEAAADNLLLTRELTRAAVEAGILTRAERGMWELYGEFSLSSRLRHLIRHPLDRYCAAVREIVEWLALAEGLLPLPTLQRLCTAEAIAQAENQGLVRTRSGHRVAVVDLLHPLQGMLIREEMPLVQQQHLYGKLAEAVFADAETTDAELVRAVRWQGLAGTTPDKDLVLRAAQAARESRDYGVALELAKLGGADCSDADSAILGIAAECSMWLGLINEAEHYYCGARRRADCPAQHAQLGVGLAANMFLTAGRVHAADQVLNEATTSVGAEHSLHSAAAALRALFSLGTCRADEALAVVDAMPLKSPALLAMKVSALTFSGRPVEAVSISLDAQVDPGSPTKVPPDLQNFVTCVALCYTGDYGAARRRANAGYQRSLALRQRSEQATWAYARGEVELVAGNPTAAVHWLREAASVMRRHPTSLGPATHAYCLANLVDMLTLTGQRGEARQVLCEIDQMPLGECHIPAVASARARSARTRQERISAVNNLSESAAVASERGALLSSARAWLDVARLGQPANAAPHLAKLAPRLEGPVAACWVKYTRALAEGNPFQLTDLAEELSAAGMNLLATEAFMVAASIHRDEGRVSEAVLALRESRCLATTIGAELEDPDIVEMPSEFPLTSREREVAGLAANGYTAAQVARKLVISRRTVESHLQHAYTKLGTHSRTELARVLGVEAGEIM